jgi:hypothetical protein
MDDTQALAMELKDLEDCFNSLSTFTQVNDCIEKTEVFLRKVESLKVSLGEKASSLGDQLSSIKKTE